MSMSTPGGTPALAIVAGTPQTPIITSLTAFMKSLEKIRQDSKQLYPSFNITPGRPPVPYSAGHWEGVETKNNRVRDAVIID